ncbi:hypothetical protein [Rivibacter subsaxonicus]|uniref:Uncharacterized protein n=1 Tax=Rivibacter subsaxonicus TaxID=457575 RepID=A0A4Q7VZ31_9BURK|nr:hypothetical protein [Rivibacter subsaxonicus]RZU02071.1 hypothetical protein EV670_0090 [Rivibacter subsaxonicus]
MNRCDRLGRRSVLLQLSAAMAALTLAAGAGAQPQVSRSFPYNALRGEIVVQSTNDLLVNGEPARMAPGVRIRGQDNLLLVTGAIEGLKFIGHYTVDTYGLVSQLWVLRDDEIVKPWPKTAQEAAKLSFDPVAQTWSKP